MPDYRALARQAADEVGVPAGVFTSLVGHESGFNPKARSPVGAQGLTQLMPSTARGLATKYGIDPNTPYGNLLGGAFYLKQQIDHFGDLTKAVAAYNAGPGAVEKYGGIPPYAETERYVRNVLADARTGDVRGVRPGMSSVPSSRVQSTQGLQMALIRASVHRSPGRACRPAGDA
jgi:soluble lytic murein transglycosylase-like protein